MSAASPLRRHRSGLFGLLAMGTLAACSSVPDWADPIAWYDGVFGEEVSPSDTTPQSPSTPEGRQRLEAAQAAPEPKVGTVPERPRATPREERSAIAAGLAADREAARYTDEELRGRPASSESLVSPPPPAAPAAAPPQPTASEPPPAAPPPAAPMASTPPAAPQVPSAPPIPSVETAPVSPSPPTAATQPLPAQVAAVPVTPPTPAPVPAPYTQETRPVATMPPPPPGSPVPPVRGTTVLESAYLTALSQSAATVTTAPANAAFVNPRPARLQQPATAVPPNVLDAYHSSVPAAAHLPPTPAPIPGPASLAPSGVSGLPPVNENVPFNRAGSRLVGTVEFRAGNAQLDRQDREILSTALAQHNTRGGTIRVVGYAPRSAGTVGAFRLSQDRANAVARELVREGANQQYVFVEAHGFAGDGAANRVEVYLEN